MESIFWLCFAALAWCYIGYPVTMLLYARLRPRPPRAHGIGEPRVSVVLAVRDGARHVRRRIENLLALDYPADRLEVLVVCNDCTDCTREIAESVAQSDTRVRVLVGGENQGKAGALNLGVAAATGEILVFADVRQSFAADAVRHLLRPFADSSVGAVSGRLVIQPSDQAAVEGVRLYWGMETQLRLAESRTGSAVGVTGAIYAVRRELFEPVPANTILDDVWVPMRLAMGGHRVVFAPEAVAFDTPAASQRQEFLRRRRTMVGNLQLLRLAPSLMVPFRNPLFLRYLSHKVLRLATPLCLVGMVGAAAFLPGVLYQGFLLMALAGLALGCLGLVVRSPLLSIPAAVVMMHLAILAAFRQYRQDAAGVWLPASGLEENPTAPLQVTADGG